MLRQLSDHKVNGLNHWLEITVLDAPGPGGANHQYVINGPAKADASGAYPAFSVMLAFQNGPIQGVDSMNGISHEALLAIIIDRLRGFQAGQFACRENAVALTNLETALMWLHKRTRDRMAREVEGTLQK